MSSSTPQKPVAAAKAAAKPKAKKESGPKEGSAGPQKKGSAGAKSNSAPPTAGAQAPKPIRRLYAHCGKNKLFLVVVPNSNTVDATMLDVLRTHNQLYPQDNAIPLTASAYRLQADMKP